MLPTIQVWEDRLGQRDASRESGSHCDSSLEGIDSNFQSPKDGRTNSANNPPPNSCAGTELRSSLVSLPEG
jgi:hypothetical protein